MALKEDPFGNYYFALEINGHEIAHFVECSGIKVTAEIYEIQEGGLNGTTHKRPKGYKWDNISLRYATSASTKLVEWIDKFLQDQYDECNLYDGAVSLKNNHGEVIRSWHFKKAWPVSWEGPQLSATGSEVAVEGIEIAFESLEIRDAGRDRTSA